MSNVLPRFDTQPPAGHPTSPTSPPDTRMHRPSERTRTDQTRPRTNSPTTDLRRQIQGTAGEMGSPSNHCEQAKLARWPTSRSTRYVKYIARKALTASSRYIYNTIEHRRCTTRASCTYAQGWLCASIASTEHAQHAQVFLRMVAPGNEAQ